MLGATTQDYFYFQYIEIDARKVLLYTALSRMQIRKLSDHVHIYLLILLHNASLSEHFISSRASSRHISAYKTII